MTKLALLASLAALIPFTLAQVAEWGQCESYLIYSSTTCRSSYTQVEELVTQARPPVRLERSAWNIALITRSAFRLD